MEDYISGIVFCVIGLVILVACLFTSKDIAVCVVGGLFMGAGIMSIVQTIIDKHKNK